MSKKHHFQEKGVIFGFGNFRRNHNFYSVSGNVLHCSGQRKLAKTDSVHENARFSSLPDTNSVCEFMLKIHFFEFSQFWMTTLKKYFYRFFGPFPFFFLFLLLQHKRDKTQNASFFSKTSFLTSRQFCKNTILTQCDTICVSKHAPKTL